MPVAACSSRLKSRTITALDIKPKRKIRALRDRPASLGRAFELGLAPVARGSARALAKGGLEVAYARACNEAPVGLVLGAPRRRDGRTSVTVGVLVARYLNYVCDGSDKRAVHETLVETGLALPANADVATLAATDLDRLDKDGDDLVLHTPLRIVRKDRSIEIAHAAPCGAETYAVYGRDGRGELAVGVLTLANGSSPCKSRHGEVSLSQPYVAPGAILGQLAAMRLKGFAH
jgi:hypothetical protein